MHRDLELTDPMFTPMKVFLNILTVFAKNSNGYNKKQSIFSPADRDEIMAVVEDTVNRIAPRTREPAKQFSKGNSRYAISKTIVQQVAFKNGPNSNAF